MIIVKIRDGLAAQMFQYAAGRQLSLHYKTQLYLDLSWFNNEANKSVEHPRNFGLDNLCVKYKKVDHHSLFWKVKLTARASNFNPFKLKTIHEKNFFSFDPAVSQAGNNIVLEGFFPSYKYFADNRRVLLKDFQPVQKMNADNEACLARIKRTNSISVHIRRGDYALSDFHGIIDAGYYARALKYLCAKVDDPALFVFSDEPEWVKKNMIFDYPFDLINFNGNDKNYFDIELMKNCRHNITANSGFSWWGAWLNENPEKIVVTPQRWVDSDTIQMDNTPPGWVVL